MKKKIEKVIRGLIVKNGKVDVIKSIKLGITAVSLASVTIFGFVYAAGSEERQIQKEAREAREAEIKLLEERNAAKIQEEKLRQETIINANKAKDIIISKGEYAPYMVETERTSVLPSDHESWIGKTLWGNTLKINIQYEVRYMMDTKSIEPYVDSDGTIFIKLNSDDLKVLVTPVSYTEVQPEKDEKGWFPTEFDTKTVLATIANTSNQVANDFVADTEAIKKGIEDIKVAIQDIASIMGANVKFLESTGKVGPTSIINEYKEDAKSSTYK